VLAFFMGVQCVLEVSPLFYFTSMGNDGNKVLHLNDLGEW